MRPSALLLLTALTLVPAAPARAWSPETALQISLEAVTITPPDLERQIERHEREFRRALLDEAKNPSGSGMALDEVIRATSERAMGLIRTHHKFSEIVAQLGIVAYYAAYANNPLIIGNADPDERSYFGDYLRYVDSARPRFAVVFYGLVPEFEASGDVDDLMRRTFRRGQLLYPLVGREYRRIGGPYGRQKFDDRSTAFGVSAVAYSQAVTDVAILLRHIWIEAGGIDPRPSLPVRKGEFQTPRTSPMPLGSFERSFAQP